MEESKSSDKEIIENVINRILEENNISNKNARIIHIAIIYYCKMLIFFDKCGVKFLKKKWGDCL